jgi:OmpA-OmpF porin, OOP family
MSVSIIVMFFTGFLAGCSSLEGAGSGRYGYFFYHKPLPEASRSLDEARKAGKDRECPTEFNAAKNMVDQSHLVYESCRTQEGIALAQEAIVKIKALCPAKPAAQVKPQPKPVERAMIQEKAPEKVSIALEIVFDTAKADIKPRYDAKIKEVADFMTKYPKTTAIIEGHTDNVGSDESNLRLSTRRAESVRNYLIQKFGIAPERLTAKGYGSSRPVADNATAEGRQKNRRINAIFENVPQ